MKKFAMLTAVAAIAAMGISATTASADPICGPNGPATAVCGTAGIHDWGGYGSHHCDDLSNPVAYVTSFGNNGVGNSQYGIGDCSVVGTPVVFAGWIFLPVVGCQGCSSAHGTRPSDSTLGGFWIGTTDDSTGVGLYK